MLLTQNDLGEMLNLRPSAVNALIIRKEYFMGHKVTSDIEKLYKDLTKVGAGKLAQKAREVFAVLDRRLFAV